jgi:arylsulfatase A-like enzyme/cephalosporin-C deacetylase-like acetyl esterase
MGLLWAISCLPLCGRAAEARPPNIVLILADDLGYGSMTCYGAPTNFIQTPNCDRLAREGVRFTDANTPSSVCSPTRYGLMTGRYCWRTERKYGVSGVSDPLQIETNRLTLASLLKRKGYNTAAIGKWHLGFGTTSPVNFTTTLRPGPQDVGFEYFFGIAQNHGDTTGVYLENDGVQGLRSTEIAPYGKTFYKLPYMGIDAPHRVEDQVMPRITDTAIDWLKKQDAAKPFFLYFASVAVHHPCTPTARIKGTSGCGLYGDWIHELDASVGRILEALETNGQSADTLVILTSDNGGVVMPEGHEPEADAYRQGFRPCGQWRGGKTSIYEGGFRVPFVVRWPDHIKPGRVCGETINLVDTLATVAALVGAPLPASRDTAEDSVNVLPALLDEPHAKPLRPSMVLHSATGVYALRQGSWKWIEGKPAQPDQRSVRKPDYNEQLYNLESDPGETTNLVARDRVVATQLRKELIQYRGGTASSAAPEPPKVKAKGRAKGVAATFSVKADHPGARYKVGEKVVFTVAREAGAGNGPMILNYALRADEFRDIATNSIVLSNGCASIEHVWTAPGTLLLLVTDPKTKANQVAGVVCEPERFGTSMAKPDDFDAFWDGMKRKVDEIPAEPLLVPVPAYTDETIETYALTMKNINGGHVRCYFAKPKSKGPFPAYMEVHGASYNPIKPDRVAEFARHGIMAIDMCPHDFEFDKPMEHYLKLGKTTLRGFAHIGKDSRDTSYFLAMFCGNYRTASYITSRPEWDGKHFVVRGFSMGGGQSFATTYLCPKVTAFAASCPALCDHTGPLAGRTAGWPRWVTFEDGKPDPRQLEAARYFDVVNFARSITAPKALVATGFIDRVCPSASVFTAYNALRCPKQFLDMPGVAHQLIPPEWVEASDRFVGEELGVKVN